MIAPEFILSNYVEAGLWIAIALGFAIAIGRIAPAVRRDGAMAAVTFLFFGLSDIVETRTGAWWRPWWLLAWKAACVTALVILLTRHYRRKRG